MITPVKVFLAALVLSMAGSPAGSGLQNGRTPAARRFHPGAPRHIPALNRNSLFSGVKQRRRAVFPGIRGCSAKNAWPA